MLALRKHQREDHDVFNYLFFFNYIQDKIKRDKPLSYLEAYVYQQVKSTKTDFFPVGQAIIAEGSGADASKDN